VYRKQLAINIKIATSLSKDMANKFRKYRIENKAKIIIATKTLSRKAILALGADYVATLYPKIIKNTAKKHLRDYLHLHKYSS
jgi:hypothetical protein